MVEYLFCSGTWNAHTRHAFWQQLLRRSFAKHPTNDQWSTACDPCDHWNMDTNEKWQSLALWNPQTEDLGFMEVISIVNGDYKITYNWGGHHLVQQELHKISSLQPEFTKLIIIISTPSLCFVFVLKNRPCWKALSHWANIPRMR